MTGARTMRTEPPIGNHVGGDGKTWSNISIKRGARGRPEPDGTANDLLHRYAKHIVGAVSAAGYSEPAALATPDPFHIPNTFEARAAIAPVQDPIRGQRIAIIGLGGTGAYLLDIIAKTPVSEIHLLDSDCVDWHTLKRAPGAPTAEEIELVRAGSLLKVDLLSLQVCGLPGRHPSASCQSGRHDNVRQVSVGSSYRLRVRVY